MGPHRGPLGLLGGPQGVSPIIPLFPFRVTRGLLALLGQWIGKAFWLQVKMCS